MTRREMLAVSSQSLALPPHREVSDWVVVGLRARCHFPCCGVVVRNGGQTLDAAEVAEVILLDI